MKEISSCELNKAGTVSKKKYMIRQLMIWSQVMNRRETPQATFTVVYPESCFFNLSNNLNILFNIFYV